MSSPQSFNTVDRIIRFAMMDAGLLQRGDVPSSDDYAIYLQKLNDVINVKQTQGLKLWTNQLVNVTLVAGTATYALGPAGSILATKPMRVPEAYFYTNANTSYPLNELSWNDYNLLSNKTSTGAINSYFVNKQQLNVYVTFWLVPDAEAATGFAQLLVQTQIQNMVSLTDGLSFPIEWFTGLRWFLADDICTGQPDSIMARCKANADKYQEILEGWDVEDAPTRFTPDPRAWFPGRNFY